MFTGVFSFTRKLRTLPETFRFAPGTEENVAGFHADADSSS
jgi:hypothetical protein